MCSTKGTLDLPNRHFHSMNICKVVCSFSVLFCAVFANGQTSTPSEAQALEQQGKLPEAEKAWRQVTQTNPRDAAAFASLGVVLSKQEKYQQAVSVYRKAIALNPKLPGIHLNWGLAEFKQQHFDAALPPLRAALAADPQNLQTLTLLGLSSYGAKQFAEAAKYLELPAKSDPANIELHSVLAQSCLSAKQYDCALAEFRQILQHDPDSAAAHMLSGEALDGLGHVLHAHFTICSAGESAVATCAPNARARICSTTSVTTERLTSASINARKVGTVEK